MFKEWWIREQEQKETCVLFSKEMRLAYFCYCSFSCKPHISFSCSLENEKRSEQWALSTNKNCKDCMVHPAATDRALKAQSRNSSIFTSEVLNLFQKFDKCYFRQVCYQLSVVQSRFNNTRASIVFQLHID